MPGQSTRWNYKTFLLLIVLLCTASIVSAEWYKDYEAGLDLLKKGRTGEAIPRLQAAIAQKSQEGLNIKFYGMKFDDYLPHYFLGKAYFSQKNYAQALKELEQSANQGQIQRNASYFQNLSELQSLAKAQINVPSPQVVTEKPKPVTPAPQPAPVEEKKQGSQVAIREQPEPPKKETVVLPKETVVLPRETNEAPPVPTLSPEDLNLQKTKLMVKDGARKYFQGDFDSAIVSFTSAIRMSPGQSSAQFLLGCAYAAKYLLSGSEDRDAYDKASLAFQQSRKMNPNQPLIKSSLISPAVREIYEKTSGA